MKPRARLVAVAAAVLGAGVVGVLVVAHWSTVRDHVEAWHFQLTRETETIEPNPPKNLPNIWSARWYLAYLAYFSEQPVILAVDSPYSQQVALAPVGGEVTIRKRLEANGYRVLEQRFPRRAYVVISDSVFLYPPAGY